MKRWRTVYYALFALYVAAQIISILQDKGVAFFSSWARDLDQVATVAITILLFLLLLHAEDRNAQLSEATGKASDAHAQLAAELQALLTVKGEAVRLSHEVQELRDEVRTSDTMLHGKLLFFQQKYRDAATILQDAVNADTSSATAHYWLGLALLRGREPKAAIPHLRIAATQATDPEYYKVLGEAEFRIRQTKEAAEHLAKALEMGVKNQEEVRLLLANVQLERDPQAAKQTLQALIDANPYNANAVTAMAEILRDEHEYDQALALCNTAIEKNQRNWAVFASRAELLSLRAKPGDLDAAKKDLDAVRIGNPRDFNLYRIEGHLFTQQAIQATNEEEKRQLLERAAAVYQDGVDIIPAPYQAPLYSAQALVYVLLGRPQDAERAATLAVEQYPTHISNHLALCGALALGARWPALQRAARRAREVGGRAGAIYSLVFELLGALCAGEPYSDLRGEYAELVTNLKELPTFAPTRRDWPHVRPIIMARTETLAGPEKEVADQCTALLDQQMPITDFVKAAGVRLGQLAASKAP